MQSLQALIMAADERLRFDIETSLEAIEGVKICAALESPSTLEPAVRRTSPDLLIVTLGYDTAPTLSCLAALAEPRPDMILCGPGDRPDLISQAMRLGARDYLPLPLQLADLSNVVAHIRTSRQVHNRLRRGAIVSVIGAKGGVGATFTTCQVAAALQGCGSQCVIVDLNLKNGDVARYHDLAPTRGVADLEREPGEIDYAYLQPLIARHESGVGVMASPLHPCAQLLLEAPRLLQVIGALQDFNDFTLIDLPRDSVGAARAVLAVTHQLILVTSLDEPALAHSRLQLHVAKRVGLPRSSTLIVSRGDASGVNLADPEIQELFGRRVHVNIPEDTAVTMEAIKSGAHGGNPEELSMLHRRYRDLARALQKRWLPEGDASTATPRPRTERMLHLVTPNHHDTP